MSDQTNLDQMCPVAARIDSWEGLGTWLEEMLTLVTEHKLDIGTIATWEGKAKTLVEELRTDHLSSGTSYQVWATEVDSDLDDINDFLDHMNQDGILSGNPAVVDGTSDTTKLRLAGTDILYQIGGRIYKCYTALETEPPTGEITENKWGAYRMDLNASGTLTVTRKANPMAYDNEEDAILSLASVARTANSIDVGYLALDAATGGFTAQTDNPEVGSAAVDAVTYTDVHVARWRNGLNTAATVAVADGAATLNISAINADVDGVKLSEIAAAATQALDDADTVTHTKWGGWLLVVDPAGTGTYCLAADGVAGTASTMAYANQAAVDTALDLVQERIPAMCCPIARIYLDNTSGANAWVGGTDDWDHDTAVATATVYPVVHSRVADDTYSIIRPTIPASITCDVPAGIGSAVTGTAVVAPEASTPGSLA